MEKISNRQIAKNMKKMLGKRVLMQAGKYEGQKGFTIRVHLKNDIKPIMMVKLDSGIEIETKHGEVMILVMENGVRIDSFPEHLTATPEIQTQLDKAEEIMKDVEKHNSKFDDLKN